VISEAMREQLAEKVTPARSYASRIGENAIRVLDAELAECAETGRFRKELVPVVQSLSRRNPVPREEFTQPALVQMRQRVQPMNAGSYLLHFDVVQSTGQDDKGWIARLPCQTQTGGVDIPESESEPQATSAEMLVRFW
jgi:hypothetical protein